MREERQKKVKERDGAKVAKTKSRKKNGQTGEYGK